jgi:hypothetical protein
MTFQPVLVDNVLCEGSNLEVVAGKCEVARGDTSDSYKECVPDHQLGVADYASVRPLFNRIPVAVHRACRNSVSL